MADHDRIVHIKTYKRLHSWNIGAFVFFVVFLYLLVTIFTYVTKERVAVYEVREGSILKDTSYNGIVLREETVVSSAGDGFINYFPEEGSKVAVDQNVYTLSPTAIETEEAEADASVELTSDELGEIERKAQNFNKTFRKENFSSLSTLKQSVSAILQSKTTQNRAGQLQALLDSGEVSGLKEYRTTEDGVIAYLTDGLEELQLEEVTSDLLKKIDYSKEEITNNLKIAQGDPAYRLITSENWKVVFALDAEMETVLREKMGDRDWANIKVRFLKDNEIMTGVFQIYQKSKKEVYGYLEFTSAMIRYAKERYLEIELILEDETGLKIPKSAVIEEDFYVIPSEYLTTGGSSTDTGVLRQTVSKSNETITEFVPVTIIYSDDENGTVYLDPSDFKANDTLILPDSAQTLQLTEKGTLQGVYNVNKGYAVFERIDILCESDAYYIIEEGSSYGLSNYDRIALYGDSVKEGQLVN